jgi:hypothetical protein
VKEISMLGSDFEEVVFKFEGRKLIVEAHNLARFALSLGHGRHLWLLEPHAIVLIHVTLNVDQ